MQRLEQVFYKGCAVVQFGGVHGAEYLLPAEIVALCMRRIELHNFYSAMSY